MELSGWTNDREVADRIARLPENQWVYGRPNSSVIMASFLHVAPDGMRFNRAELGAWYAAKAVETAIAEVAHHLRSEEHTSELQSLMRNSYAVFCLKKNTDNLHPQICIHTHPTRTLTRI